MSPAGGGNASLRDPRWIALFFAFGLAISILMVARSQVAGDQLNHLGRGWHLAMEGRWVPFGPPATKGGAQIGGVNGLLVGLPLMLWEDHRAPTAVVLLFHLAAYLLLDRLARRALRPEERFLFALLYWLNPWRLFFSGFLWNPNYLLLAGAVHLWTAWRLKERPRFWLSFLHVLALGLAMQIHVACLMLVIASLLLWWRRYLRLHLGGAVVAGLVVAATLVPWALEVIAEPGFLPAGEGFPGRGLLTVHPVLKGLAHWLRFPGLAFGHAMTCLDFSRLGGPGLDRLKPFLEGFKAVSLPATVLLAGLVQLAPLAPPPAVVARLRRPRAWATAPGSAATCAGCCWPPWPPSGSRPPASPTGTSSPSCTRRCCRWCWPAAPCCAPAGPARCGAPPGPTPCSCWSSPRPSPSARRPTAAASRAARATST